MINWHIVSSEAYHAGVPVDTSMYFLEDTHEIYRGSELFTQAVNLYEGPTMPTTPAVNRLYIEKTSLEGWIYNGTDWVKVINAVSDTVSPDGTAAVNGKAVAAYVAAELAKVNAGVVDLSWDAENKTLNVTKAGQEPTGLVLSGLVNGMRYDNATGKLYLQNDQGEDVGTAVDLGLEQFVRSGEVIEEEVEEKTETFIVLYFDEEKTNFIKIKATSLIDTYTAEGSTTLNLSVADHKITGSVKISANEGNMLSDDGTGLYVAGVDVSSKMDKDSDAAEGDIAVFDGSGNAVSSGKTFADLASNNSVYVGELNQSQEEVLAGKTPVKGDILILRKKIGETDKVEHTAYVAILPDAESGAITWQAMDGNYSAENVFFPANLITTNAIGNIKLTNGQAVIPAAGKNLIDVWNSIFVKKQVPVITQPSVAVNFSNAASVEVGTQVTPAYNATFNAGKYSYGPSTDVTVTSWSVALKKSVNSGGYEDVEAAKNTNSGTFSPVFVGDNETYRFTATAIHTDGAVPKYNTGEEYPDGKILGGDSHPKTANSGTFTGYRKYFMGSLSQIPAEFNSAFVRSLPTSANAANLNSATDTNRLTMSVKAGHPVFAIAYPASMGDIISIKDANNFESISAFTKTSVQVADARGNDVNTMEYKLYYCSGSSYSANTEFKIRMK